MANEYKNKVIYGGNTLIDLTGDDVTAADVASGKKFHLPSGEPAVGTGSGGSSAIIVIDEQLPGGGIAKHITGVDISSDTVDAEHLAEGYTAHDSTGAAITGTMQETIIEPDPLDVDFIDYDGTLLHTYSAVDFLNLSELPPNPHHDGLIAQGWNWTLEDAQEYVNSYGTLVVGQNYVTQDGKTKIYVTLNNGGIAATDKLVKIRIVGSTGTDVVIDWGDGSTTNYSFSGTNSNYRPSKTYSEYGDYVINIESTGPYTLGYNGSNSSLMSDNEEDECGYVTNKIEVGSNVVGFARGAFRGLINLKSISVPVGITSFGDFGGNGTMFTQTLISGLVIPNGITSIPYQLFDASNINLKYISFPKTITTIGAAVIGGAYRLRKFTIPPIDNLTNGTVASCFRLTHASIPGTYSTIGGDTLRGMRLVREFRIPASVTSIASYGMSWPSKMLVLHCEPTTPPTLGNVRIMSYIVANDGVIYVPYSEDHSVLEAYKTANNWKVGASIMQEEAH